MPKRPFISTLAIVLGLFCPTPRGSAESVPLKPSPQMKVEIVRLLDVLDRVTETKFFHKGGPSDEALVWFAVLYNNNLGPYHKGDSAGRYRLPAAYVDQLTMRYFGKRVKHRSFSDHPFMQGYYLATGSDAAQEQQIRIDWVNRLGNNVYEANGTFTDRVTRKVTSRRKITLKRVGQGKQSRFIVLEYGQGCAC